MKRMYALRAVILFFAVAMSTFSLRALTVWELWQTMPDTIEGLIVAPYRGYIAAVDSMPNRFEGYSRLDTLASDEMRVSLTSRTSLHLRLLPASEGSDSVVCVVHTYSLVAPESSVRVYDRQWNLIADVTFPLCDLTAKPDTMSPKRYDELLQLYDPYLVGSAFSDSEWNAIYVSAAAAMVADEQRDELATVAVRRKYVWNGSTFVPQ